MKTTESSFKNDFADSHLFKSSIFSTRATGLLYSLLKVESQNSASRTKVLLPSITCGSLVHSCIASGMTPIFYDCVETNLNADPTSAKKLLIKHANELALIVVIHQFGNWSDLRELFAMASILGVPSLEDRCQLLNPELPDQGSDYVLFSFGSTKTLNCNSGAALCSTKGSGELPFLEISEVVGREFSLSVHGLAGAYRRDWYEFNRSNGYRDLTSDLAHFEKYKTYLLWGNENANFSQISQRWNVLDDLNRLRRSKSSEFARVFEYSEPFRVHSDNFGFSVPWRYVVSASSLETRDEVVNQLREKSLHVSTWYVSLKLAFPSFSNALESHVDLISTKLLNFWVDENAQEHYVQEVAAVVRSVVN